MLKRILFTILCLLAAVPALAQDATPTPQPTPFPPIPLDTGIYVTTQDFISLREGPGLFFDRIDVLDPAITLMAIGRTADTDWVQVVEDSGRRGWLSVRYVVYSGDVVRLPVDGVDPAAFIRQAGVIGTTTRETRLYEREIAPGLEIGTLPQDTTVELVGRLGSGFFARYQIIHEGQLYWVGAWDIRVEAGNLFELFDTAYLYPYGRILAQLNQDLGVVEGSLQQIDAMWRTIDDGGSVSCADVPPRASREIADFDVRQEALFAPAVIALDEAIALTNGAVSSMEDACANATEDGFFVTRGDVRNALANTNDAFLHLSLSRSMYQPLERRNPLLDLLSGTSTQ